MAYKAIYTKETYMKEFQREPTVEEIAEKVGVGKKRLYMQMDAIQSPMSLYEPVYTGRYPVCYGSD